MRAFILVGAAVALASCGGNDSGNETAVGEETSAAEVAAVNDATAIDAATGAAADRAADVIYTFNEDDLNETDSNEAANNSL